MREKLINAIRFMTYYPRKVLDWVLYHAFLSRSNRWDILNKYTNKPLLIVGNGPSLNKTPLDQIDSISIGMNKINLLYNSTKWRPEMIVCTNGLVLNQNKEYFNSTDAILFVPTKAYYLGIKKRANVLFFNTKDEFKISTDIQKSISSGCTVTFLALQIAAHLEPTTVNIVGVDHSFVYKGKEQEIQKMEGDDVNHFSKDYFKGQYWGIPNLDESEYLYQLSKDYFESRNIPITDYTVNGKLMVFNKKPIDDLID